MSRFARNDVIAIELTRHADGAAVIYKSEPYRHREAKGRGDPWLN